MLQEPFIWILDNADFIDWRNNDLTKLLWIKGGPGKGKTSLMIGLIDELSKQMESKPESEISAYFFCQGTDERLRSAASVLRGLIYLLAIKKRNLIRHNGGATTSRVNLCLKMATHGLHYQPYFQT